MIRNWTTADIPPQAGHVAIVTGTGGIGFETALALTRAGAQVILAGRSESKGRAAVASIASRIPRAKITFGQIDLADLASVARFASAIKSSHSQIDILINNAGIMMPPKRLASVNGFELQLATNYLGHFALTAHILPLLQQGRRGRLVTLSSIAARNADIMTADLNCERAYEPMEAYAQSKLACLLFALELQRRSDEHDWGIDSIAAHPGVSRTNLIPNSADPLSSNRLIRLIAPFLFQHPSQGALPVLFAATDPDAAPGGYYGPSRLFETRGHPAFAKIPDAATEAEMAEWLWLRTEQMTGIRFPQRVREEPLLRWSA